MSSLGVRNTEEVIQETPAADSDVVCSVSEVKTVRPVRRRRLLHVALVAAATIVILFAIAATASAMGYNILGWVPKWNNDVLGFGEEGSEAKGFHDSSRIPAALEQLGIDEPLYPHWLPDDLESDVWVIEKDPVFLHEGYSDGDRYLSITIEPSATAQTYIYQKEDAAPFEYISNDMTFYIVYDNGRYTAIWKTENYSVYIAGNIALDEMKQILDSVKEAKK